ncbi:hypothetical protein CDL15_Pgr002271 [Punica granatum]|uniref:Uncharacterized protein n=1 Tax=Punica granatum TaxID=22663 RepID=A0A218WGI4_PUNGR|nr:hypothetical protein CDL15_Pgr002271 [Punica granatum]
MQFPKTRIFSSLYFEVDWTSRLGWLSGSRFRSWDLTIQTEALDPDLSWWIEIIDSVWNLDPKCRIIGSVRSTDPIHIQRLSPLPFSVEHILLSIILILILVPSPLVLPAAAVLSSSQSTAIPTSNDSSLLLGFAPLFLLSFSPPVASREPFQAELLPSRSRHSELCGAGCCFA